MNKKLLATVLASTMVLGSVSAYAAAEVPTVSGSAVEISDPAVVASGITIPGDTKIEPVIIKVTLPAQLPIMLNPYSLDSLGQVLSPTIKILNTGNTDIKVTLSKWKVEIPNADATTKPVLATAPVLATSTKKEAFLYLQSNDGKGGTLPSTYDTTKDKTKVVPAKVGDTVATVSYGSIPKTSGELELQLQGNLSTNVSWTIADTIIVSPTFKFDPTITVTP